MSGSGPIDVKHGRLAAVVGLLLIVSGFAVLVAWAVVGPTVYNSVPFLGVGVIVVGVVVNRRSSGG